MNIVFISHYTTLYGANRSLLNLIDGLSEYGVKAHVIVPALGDLSSELQNRQIPFAVFPLAWWVGIRKMRAPDWRHPVWSFKNYWRSYAGIPIEKFYKNVCLISDLTQQLNLWKIDIVYTNTSVTPIGAFVAFMSRRPHVWHLREYGDLDYGFSFDWGKRITQLCIATADIKIAISQAIKKHFSLGDSKNTFVIYNGVAFKKEFDELFELSRIVHDTHNPDAPYTFGLVGMIHPAKNQTLAIEAIAQLSKDNPSVRLLIIGDGDIQALKKLTISLGVDDRVEFIGFVKDIQKEYLLCDAILMCSRSEGMGRVTVEAMAACRPVIGFDRGGTSEIIVDEYTGLLYRDGLKDLVECMTRFIKDPDWAYQLGINAWQVARKEYTIEAYSQRIYAALASVIEEAQNND